MNVGTKAKRRRICNYSKDWEADYKWLKSDREDGEIAKCILCSVSFTIKWDGIRADSATHKKKAAAEQQGKTISAFLTHIQNVRTVLHLLKLFPSTTVLSIIIPTYQPTAV